MARIPGKPQAKFELLRDLDESSFPHLVGDILYHVFRHTGIKVVDGPGDGRRDIHSITPEGYPHITQCKYHRDSSQAVSPREVEELPVALLKFDATHGLFATTGRLTPQTQREFLDQYKRFDLTYVQGPEIVDYVLSDPILASVWFDGKAIGRVRHTLAVPFIVRSLRSDKPIALASLSTVPMHSQPDRHTRVVLEDLVLAIQSEFVSSAVFEPYRAPEHKTREEQWLPQIKTAICSFHGHVPIYRVTAIIEALPAILKGEIPICSSSDTLAVRFGAPYFTVLEGSEEGRTVVSGIAASTVVFCADGTWEWESNWLLPSQPGNWQFCWDWKAMTADWARWYNYELDCCLNLQVISPAGPGARGQIQEQRAYTEKWWNASFFLVGTPTGINEFTRGLPATERPMRRYSYGPHGEMAAWFHPNLGPGFLYPGLRELLLEGMEDIQEGAEPPEQADQERDTAFAALVKRLRMRASSSKLQEVDGGPAYHIAAASGENPFPDGTSAIYRPFELAATYWEDIPSPINPRSRHFVFEKVWTVDSDSEEVAEQLSALTADDESLVCEIDMTSCLQGTTLFVTVELTCPPEVSTPQFLGMAPNWLAEVFEKVEACLLQKGWSVSSSTRSYWEQEIGILIGNMLSPGVGS